MAFRPMSGLEDNRPGEEGEVPLIRAKLQIPPRHRALIPRTRLLERLRAGLQGRLTLVSAPAGYGKTTLLATWALDAVHDREADGRASQVRWAWLSLDVGDNDLVRFVRYLVAALQAVAPGCGRATLAALGGSRPPRGEALLAGLINELDKAAAPFVLVLDDYHEIQAEAVHQAVTLIVDHLPAHGHLVVATRADPPLPLARLRARGQMAELRQADLRFGDEETALFLRQVMGLDLSPDDVATLAARTEGWVSGLQMAALSMRDRDDTSAFVQAFAGSDRHVLDYLLEEVLQRQPAEVQTFLLQTSILERLSGALCDALLDDGDGTPGTRSSSSSILDYLERANLFVVPLDNRREWYRYHQLFAGLLRHRLQQVWPARPALLHRRAADWYEGQGWRAGAVSHALAGHDFERAARLIESEAERMLMRSEGDSLLRWIEALPPQVVHARPQLCVYHAGALILGSRPLHAIEDCLRAAEEGDRDGAVAGEVAAYRGLLAVFRGDLQQAGELLRQALARLPAARIYLRGLAADNLGIVYMMRGELDAAEEVLTEAARMAQAAGNAAIGVGALSNLAGMHLTQGHLHRAAELYRRALELATDDEGRLLPIAGKALLGLGELARHWNDLAAAERHLSAALDHLRLFGELGAVAGYASLAFVKQALGQPQVARDLLARAEMLAARFDATDLDDRLIATCQARLWLAQGEVELAARWAATRQVGSTIESAFPDLHEVEHLALARLALAQERPGEALALLEPLLGEAQRLRRLRRVPEILALQALAHRARGEQELACSTLVQALAIARPEGFIRVFVDEGQPLRALLGTSRAWLDTKRTLPAGLDKDRLQAYIDRLLQAFGPVSSPPPVPASRATLPLDSLSEREIEILRLLDGPLSTTEIAGLLVVSANTVRFHVKNIYVKLGVHRRSDAVDRARVLGLI